MSSISGFFKYRVWVNGSSMLGGSSLDGCVCGVYIGNDAMSSQRYSIGEEARDGGCSDWTVVKGSEDFVGCSLSFLVVDMARKEKVSGTMVGSLEEGLVEKWDYFTSVDGGGVDCSLAAFGCDVVGYFVAI
ncbi:hypothetical protein KY290_024940 [Solanum tuberosum]|uniref:Uncharacterized protein n=1 Tax=Solanum tuberosum TaxID=4113 RepID=A0ABQ7US64_SOLTU|nr:hypothetical protein KY284_023797 [Solanum tuberosum]KAH0754670.1 hypothetical protein KY290_024940 [Solanum tuberosum]